MKYLLTLLLFSFYCVKSSGQKIEKYYDYNWKECEPVDARFFSVTQKTDTGWYRVDYYLGSKSPQMIGLYKDEKCTIKNGLFRWYCANGNLQTQAKYNLNKLDGLQLKYHYNGSMADSGNYLNDELVGSRLFWYTNGFMSDSITNLGDGKFVFVSWFDNGLPSEMGYKQDGEKIGTWNFYNIDGKLTAKIKYNNGKEIQNNYYNGDGEIVTDSLQINTNLDFKYKKKDWGKYLNSQLYWPTGYEFTNGSTAVIVINFTINEKGNVEDAFVEIPFHKAFDNIALSAIKNSPAWTPQKKFNRAVKTNIRQAITFSQTEGGVRYLYLY